MDVAAELEAVQDGYHELRVSLLVYETKQNVYSYSNLFGTR